MTLTRHGLIASLIAFTINADSSAPPRVHFENGRVSINARDVPARALLDELSKCTRVDIATADNVAQDTISIELRNIPLEDALRTILGAYDAFFYYQAGKDGTQKLRSIWVYPMGAAKSLRPVPPEVWAGTKELEAGLADADANVRGRAYEALMQRPNARSQDLLIQALRGREADDVLRQRILLGAMSKGIDIPPAVLNDLARGDRSEEIRWAALDALSQHESAREIAEVLKLDSSDTVRQRAVEILAELEAASRHRERPPVSPPPDR